MKNISMLYPVFALAGWTFLVLIYMAYKRIAGGVRQGRVKPGDFRYGESAAVPPDIALPNRNYMNLLELPVLFYVVCLLIFSAGIVSSTMVTLAWCYVGLRVVHSLIHIGYNNVLHRLIAFASSNFVLAALWVMAALGLSAIS